MKNQAKKESNALITTWREARDHAAETSANVQALTVAWTTSTPEDLDACAEHHETLSAAEDLEIRASIALSEVERQEGDEIALAVDPKAFADRVPEILERKATLARELEALERELTDRIEIAKRSASFLARRRETENLPRPLLPDFNERDLERLVASCIAVAKDPRVAFPMPSARANALEAVRLRAEAARLRGDKADEAKATARALEPWADKLARRMSEAKA
jgi:hypothetical protein